MSDTDTEKETETTDVDKTPAPAEKTDTKDWQSEAEKWKALARQHESRAKANADAAKRLGEIEDSAKSDLERERDKAADAERRAGDAERRAVQLEVALDKAPEGMSLTQVRKLSRRLAGTSREELEADAEELFTDFAPAKDDANADKAKQTGDDDESENGRRRPKERLKPGTVSDAEPEEKDPVKLAAQVSRGW